VSLSVPKAFSSHVPAKDMKAPYYQFIKVVINRAALDGFRQRTYYFFLSKPPGLISSNPAGRDLFRTIGLLLIVPLLLSATGGRYDLRFEQILADGVGRSVSFFYLLGDDAAHSAP